MSLWRHKVLVPRYPPGQDPFKRETIPNFQRQPRAISSPLSPTPPWERMSRAEHDSSRATGPVFLTDLVSRNLQWKAQLPTRDEC